MDTFKKLYIETTSRCNINCEMCVKRFSDNYEEGDMELDTFQKLIPSMKHLDYINLNGIGEPLLNKNIFKYISLSKENIKPSGEVGFTTNGILLNEENAEKIISAGLDKIVISLDSTNPEILENMRKGASFETIEKNLDAFNQIKKKKGTSKPLTGFEIVITRDNFREIPKLIKFASEKDVRFIIVSHVLPYSYELNKKKVFEPLSKNSFELYERTKKRLASEGIDIKDYANLNFLLLKHQKDAKSEKFWSIIEEALEEAKTNELFLNIPRLIEIDGDKILSEVIEIFEKSQKLSEELNIDITLPPVIPDFSRKCSFIEDDTCFVSWDGYVSTCLRVLHNNKYYLNECQRETHRLYFGNIKEKPVEEIWNNSKYKSLRDKVKRFDFPNCLDCSGYDSCGYFKDNFDYDCYGNEEPCADCLWSKNILHCL
ncbi:MAG: radical SAM protein [Candidatus Schekmanbacteria bacterium]|nr:MAG: radical SAM protein [Candidatus Schekmanbacteria bacterium]